MGVIGRIRSAIAGLMGSNGGYNATDPRRVTNRGRLVPRSSTANQILTGNLPSLRARCRQLERNHPTARAAILGRVALVVGSGIDLMPDTGNPTMDRKIKAEWVKWCKHAGVNGESIYELERYAYREETTVGESLCRIVMMAGVDGFEPRILPLESEWIEDTVAIQQKSGTGYLVGGIYTDMLGRPRTYRLCNPDIIANQQVEEVPADAIVHTYEAKRAFQIRGEPPLAPCIETLSQEEDLITAELEAAKNTAGVAVAITSDMHDSPEEDEAGDAVYNFHVGSATRLAPGEDIKTISNTRPSQQIAPFSKFLRNRIAAALKVPVRYLDRDVGGATYMNIRADFIDSDRLNGPDQDRFGEQFLGKIYRVVLPILAVRAGVKLPSSNAYRLVPDGTPYVDPGKDVLAASGAMAAGLSTLEYEVGKRGRDWQEVLTQRSGERIEIAKKEIAQIVEIQKAINEAIAATPGLRLSWSQIATLKGSETAPGAYLQAAAMADQAAAAEPEPSTEKEQEPANA